MMQVGSRNHQGEKRRREEQRLKKTLMRLPETVLAEGSGAEKGNSSLPETALAGARTATAEEYWWAWQQKQRGTTTKEEETTIGSMTA
ncbi:hypothetical protein M569_04527 [Genlisea aurea]|uniref:Uncharacterized protein n=1 Tax=Genlisea aurea TaxID=192259 RepID=S8E3F5_9LAMI|nr:hypothetical protein M569_04527 [Genlisea aurea]